MMARPSICRCLVAGGVALAALLAGCGGSLPSVGGKEPPRQAPTFVVLADNSLDATAEARAESLRVVGIVARAAAGQRGTVAIAAFQRHALGSISWPISHTFEPSEAVPAGNSYYAEQDLERQVRELLAQARSLFSNRQPTVGTDIVGSLIAAAERFAAAGAGRRVLVLSSNMLAVSPADGLRFKRQRLTPGFIAKTLRRLKREEKIPDLAGVCVHVVGAGLAPTAEIPTSQQLGLRRFWQGYFERAGASLAAWEPTLTGLRRCDASTEQ